MDDTTAAPADTASSDTQAIEPRGTTLATLGFLMAAAGPLLLLVASLLFGLDAGDAAFLVLPAAFGLIGAYLVRRPSTVAKAIAIVLAVFTFGLVFWMAFGLALPGSFLDFVPGILLLPGVLLAIGGSITSLRSAKRGRASGPGERRAALTIVGALGVLAALSLVLTVTSRETVDDEAAANADVVVDLKDFKFDEDAYEVAGGGTVLVKNSDPFVHNFTIDALDIDVDLGPGSEKLVAIPDEPGTYIVYCEPHTSDPDDPSEDDMGSEITVD
jgi:plastocyanin